MPFSIKRKKTRQIRVGDVKIGGDAPICVQSMTNTPTSNIPATVSQIKRLADAGCEIVRVAVPDMSAATAITAIKAQIDIPLIADIHFDYRLALAAARAGADGLRLNPGNIGGARKVKAVVDCARDANIAIRIGVNAGSLEKDLLKKYRGVTAEAMVASALRQIDLMRSLDFNALKLSIKASDVHRTVEAYRLLSAQTDLPLHVGVTESGTLIAGTVKSALGIGMLLLEGIGDTIRVSLTRDPVEEIRAAYEILRALDIRQFGPEIISCPTCGRCDIDLFDIVEQIETELWARKKQVKVAVMGCVVNGPGEAREADIGVAGGAGSGVLFKKGKVVKKVPQGKLVEALLAEVDRFNESSDCLS